MKELYVYALSTSPRRSGNTEILLDRVLEGVRASGIEVIKEVVSQKTINPCQGCNRCTIDGHCVQKDQMQEIYSHLLQAAGIILAAPIFSMHICAQAKVLIDRCQRFWAVKYVLKRPVVEDERLRSLRRGLFLSVCGRNQPETFACVRPTIGYFFHVLEVEKWSRLEVAGVDEKGAIKGYPDALEQAYQSGLHLLEKSG